MSQSRLGSITESLANVFIGYLVAVGSNILVLPAFGYPVTAGDAAGIGLIFTLISLLRSYLLRRWFNRIRSFYADHSPQ